MGDNLAELLYTTHVNAGTAVAGGDVPNWASLPAVEREQWEQVAVKARRTMAKRFVDSIDEHATRLARSELRAATGLAVLRRDWAR